VPMRAVTACGDGADGVDMTASATTSSKDRMTAEMSDIKQPKTTCAACAASHRRRQHAAMTTTAHCDDNAALGGRTGREDLLDRTVRESDSDDDDAEVLPLHSARDTPPASHADTHRRHHTVTW
jgi:hypothetical protein